jgi:hypothetical protein
LGLALSLKPQPHCVGNLRGAVSKLLAVIITKSHLRPSNLIAESVSPVDRFQSEFGRSCAQGRPAASSTAKKAIASRISAARPI